MCSYLSSFKSKIVYLITDCKGKWVSLDLSIAGPKEMGRSCLCVIENQTTNLRHALK